MWHAAKHTCFVADRRWLDFCPYQIVGWNHWRHALLQPRSDIHARSSARAPQVSLSLYDRLSCVLPFMCGDDSFVLSCVCSQSQKWQNPLVAYTVHRRIVVPCTVWALTIHIRLCSFPFSFLIKAISFTFFSCRFLERVTQWFTGRLLFSDRCWCWFSVMMSRADFYR